MFFGLPDEVRPYLSFYDNYGPEMRSCDKSVDQVAQVKRQGKNWNIVAKPNFEHVFCIICVSGDYKTMHCRIFSHIVYEVFGDGSLP